MKALSYLNFDKKYAILTLLLFIIEVGIALFVRDRIVRPYIGDLLVVILLYCAFKSVVNVPVKIAIVAVLCFAYTIETLQYLHIVEKIGLQHSRVAVVVIGNSFSWEDIAMYTAGALLVFIAERKNIIAKRKNIIAKRKKTI